MSDPHADFRTRVENRLPVAATGSAADRAVAAVLATVDLHEPRHDAYGHPVCAECSNPEAGVYVFAPCETLREIAHHLGVEVGRWDPAGVRPAARRVRVERLEDAIRWELICLWSDLDERVRFAHGGCWSGGCMDAAERIADLTRLVGPAPWEQVSYTLLLDGTYQRVHREIGIEVDLPLEEIRAQWDEIQRREREPMRPVGTPAAGPPAPAPGPAPGQDSGGRG